MPGIAERVAASRCSSGGGCDEIRQAALHVSLLHPTMIEEPELRICRADRATTHRRASRPRGVVRGSKRVRNFAGVPE